MLSPIKQAQQKADSWIDIEGGIGNLFSYASLRRRFADEIFAVDGEGITLSKNGTFMGHHILLPKKEWRYISTHSIFRMGHARKSCGKLACRRSRDRKTGDHHKLFNGGGRLRK
jgi:hypothetical protein